MTRRSTADSATPAGFERRVWAITPSPKIRMIDAIVRVLFFIELGKFITSRLLPNECSCVSSNPSTINKVVMAVQIEGDRTRLECVSLTLMGNRFAISGRITTLKILRNQEGTIDGCDRV